MALASGSGQGLYDALILKMLLVVHISWILYLKKKQTKQKNENPQKRTPLVAVGHVDFNFRWNIKGCGKQ